MFEDARGWLGPVLALVLVLTGLRVAALWYDSTDLFVDEAQYWLWGQSLEFGYYSKPPMIGWVIRLVTELAGSDARFWVRLPAPILHGTTALVLATIAARLAGRRAAIWVAAIYLTMPMVAVGSYMISTDTVMFPFLATALGAWLVALDRRAEGGGAGWAALAGVALGIAFLSKYAALYYLIGAVAGALVLRSARPGWAVAGVGLLAFLLTILPNIWWNLANGLTTLEHTMDNADWVRDPGARAELNLPGLAEFFGAQFFVFGPVLFGALLGLAVRGGGGGPRAGLLLIIAVPIVALVCGQAVLSRAYANWAAAAYLAGVLVVVPWLLTRDRFGLPALWASIAIGAVFALLIPAMTIAPERFALGDRPLAERYLGRAEMSAAILQAAEDSQAQAIVANDRDILADLFHQTALHPTPTPPLFAEPVPGRPPHHYAQRYPYPGAPAPILYVSRRAPPPEGCIAQELPTLAPDAGAYRKRPQRLFLIEGPCW